MTLKHRTLRLAVLVLVATGACWPQATETVTVGYNGYPVSILPDYYDTISVIFITVPRAFNVTKVTAKVDIAYPQVGDLKVYLYSPDGKEVKLLEHNCGTLRNVVTTFDDSAPSRYSDFCPAEAGRGPFRGNDSLSAFNSVDSSIGVWTLAVENDESDSRAGSLRDVTLTITGTPQAQPYFRLEQVLNSANLRSGVVSPGQVVSIAGSNMGPSEPVITGAGAWPTTLGDVRVTVNGTAVPIRYASSTRVDVQMPFTLTGTASIQVNYGSNASGIVAVPVQATFPGLFALQSGGTGQARAANQDWTPNSVQNPALRGSYIYVFGVGLGNVTPPAVAGEVPPSVSVATNPVAASIGGRPAVVSYAGSAPGVVGLYQINILVPNDAPTGKQDLIISNGGTASQNGLTVQIR